MSCSTCNKPFPSSEGPGVGSYLPSLPVQLRTATTAIYRAAGAVLHGEAVQAKPETIAQREAICFGSQPATFNLQPATACRECIPVIKGDKTYHRCSQCGCWLDGKFFAKLKLATESCPLGKW